jgi:transposase-like protein
MSEKQELVQVRRPRRSAAVIEQLVAEYAASGLGQVEFCRRRGLALSTLKRHLHRHDRAQKPDGTAAHADASSNALVAVELLQRKDKASPSGCLSGLSVSLARDRRIEIDCGFDQETLLRLVAVLERA